MATDNAKIKLVLDPSRMVRGLRTASRSFDRAADRMRARADRMNASFLVATAQVAGLGLALKKIAGTAADIESVTTQFEVLTGSADTAKQSIEELLQFSAKTPFQFQDIAQSGQILLAFGVQAEDLREKMQRIGDVSAATGADLQELTKIFGQVKGEGKLMGERLQQLNERGIAIGPAIRKVFRNLGKEAQTSGLSIKDLGAKGLITFEIFEKAFDSLSDEGGPAFEGMIKRSRTLSGLVSTLKDNWSLLLQEIGNRFLPQFKEAAIAITKLLQRLKSDKSLILTIERVFKLAAVVTTLRLAFLLGGQAALRMGAMFLSVAAGAMKAMAIGLVRMSSLSGMARKAMLVLAKTTSFAGKIMKLSIRGAIGATGLGLLVLFIPDLIDLFNKFKGTIAEWARQAVDGLRRFLKWASVLIDTVLPGLGKFVDKFSEGMEVVGDAAKKAANFGIGALEKRVKRLGNILGDGVDLAGVSTVFNAFWKDAFASSKVGVEAIAGTVDGLGDLLSAVFTGDWADASAAWEKIKGSWTKGAQEFREIAAQEDDLTTEQMAKGTSNREKIITKIIEEEREIRRLRGQELTEADIEAMREQYAQKTEAELATILGEQEKTRMVLAEHEKTLTDFRMNEEKEKTKLINELIKEQWEESRAQGQELNAQEVADLTAHYQAMSLSEIKAITERDKAIKKLTDVAAKQRQSGNALMKAVGTAGVIAQKGLALKEMWVGTHKAANQVFTWLNASAPWLAPWVGAAGKGLILADGYASMAEVRKANFGGLVSRAPGSTGGPDSQPFMLSPGELINPAPHVPKIIDAAEETLRRRDEGPEEQMVGVQISFIDDASSTLQAERIENQDLGVGVR